MGLLYKAFPCGCVISMCNFGFDVGGHRLEKNGECDAEREHIQEAYKESNANTGAELVVELL